MTIVLILVILIQLASLCLMYEVIKALHENDSEHVKMKRKMNNFNDRQEADKIIMVESANVVSRYENDLKIVKEKLANLEKKSAETDKAIEQLKGWSGK